MELASFWVVILAEVRLRSCEEDNCWARVGKSTVKPQTAQLATDHID